MHRKVRFLEVSRGIGQLILGTIRVETKIVDVVAFININTTKTSRTFGEYYSVAVMEKVRRILQSVAPLDFVFYTLSLIVSKDKTK